MSVAELIKELEKLPQDLPVMIPDSDGELTPARSAHESDYLKFVGREWFKRVCAVCAQALWHYYGDHCMPTPTEGEDGFKRYDGLSAGDFIHRCARRNLGASLAKRWFN